MQRRSLSRYAGMSSGGLFAGNWQLKGSAIIGSIFIVMLLAMLVFVIKNMPPEELGDALNSLRQDDPNATENDLLLMMLATMAMLMSPMIIGNILNWIGSIKKRKPILIVAGIMYLLVIPMDPMFSPFAIIPAVLAFFAAHKLDKKPELRHL